MNSHIRRFVRDWPTAAQYWGLNTLLGRMCPQNLAEWIPEIVYIAAGTQAPYASMTHLSP
jgi:hypothetical protein